MKDQYFADINDYRKYGVLRILAEVTGLRIGVCWMFTSPDGRADGALTRYLGEPKQWRSYDPKLFDLLCQCKGNPDLRRISSAEKWEILPRAVYYRRPLVDAAAERAAYFARAWREFSKCSVIFFDPDNGFEVRSVPYGRTGSSRYLYWAELNEAFTRGYSVVVYQHFPRQPRAAFIAMLMHRLQNHTHASVVYSYATPRVAFLLAPQPEHQTRLDRAGDILTARWGLQVMLSSLLPPGPPVSR